MTSRINAVSRTVARLGLEKIRDVTRVRPKLDLTERQRQVMKKLRQDGVAVIDGFYDQKKCQDIKVEIDRLIDSNKDDCWHDEEEADFRYFGSNLACNGIKDYFEDPMISGLACMYLKSTECVGYTMSNRTRFQPGNRGSGGGFHRDNAGLRDFKAILYLTDVDESNGPFQYWIGSHRFKSRLGLIWKNGAKWRGKRFEEDEEAKHIEMQPDLKSIVGPSGTLVIADTVGIHRGKPIESGCRYALTNYYWRNPDVIPAGMTDLVKCSGNPIQPVSFSDKSI